MPNKESRKLKLIENIYDLTLPLMMISSIASKPKWNCMTMHYDINMYFNNGLKMCRRFSTVFINGKSFIKISTDFPTNDTLLDTVMLDTTPYISNSLNVFPENWKYAKKVAATRIKLNLFDKQLKLDPVQLKDHPAINQISLTNSSIRATGQSRIIIVPFRNNSELQLLIK